MIADTTPDTGDFDTVRQAVVRVVGFGKGMYLSFATQSAKRSAKHDAIIVDMKIGAAAIIRILSGDS